MSQQADQDQPDFSSVPPGSIPASQSGVYRHDHYDLVRTGVYRRNEMQQQWRGERPERDAQQMQMQRQI